MFAVLHCFGNLPVKKEIFMIMVGGIFNFSLNSFRIRFGIEFGPKAFLVLVLPIMLVISFSVTGCSRREGRFLFFKWYEKCLLDFLCYCSKKTLQQFFCY